jgi:hypothetical protein
MANSEGYPAQPEELVTPSDLYYAAANHLLSWGKYVSDAHYVSGKVEIVGATGEPPHDGYYLLTDYQAFCAGGFNQTPGSGGAGRLERLRLLKEDGYRTVLTIQLYEEEPTDKDRILLSPYYNICGTDLNPELTIGWFVYRGDRTTPQFEPLVNQPLIIQSSGDEVHKIHEIVNYPSEDEQLQELFAAFRNKPEE